MIQYRPGGARRILLHAPGHQYRQHSIAALDSAPDDVTIVCRPRDDGNSILQIVELVDALLPANSDYLVAALQRMLRHVPAELAGDADDANLFHGSCVVSM